MAASSRAPASSFWPARASRTHLRACGVEAGAGLAVTRPNSACACGALQARRELPEFAGDLGAELVRLVEFGLGERGVALQQGIAQVARLQVELALTWLSSLIFW